MTWFKTNFDLDNLRLEICQTNTNILPDDFRKKVFSWCGSGTLIMVHYSSPCVNNLRTYETVKEFIIALQDLDNVLGYLKKVNTEFKARIVS